MAPTLKVCFYVFFPAGGIGRYTHELARELNKHPEVDVEIACTADFQWKDAAAYQVWPGLKEISHPIPVLRRMRFIQGQFVNPVRCIDHAVASGAQIIHFSNINHLSFPYWKQHLKASGLRVVASVHDVKRQKSIINFQWEDTQLKAFYRFADALFVHSEYQAGELIEYAGVGREKIHVVPHGPYSHGSASGEREAARMDLGLPLDKQVALFFGQIRDEKGLDRYIKALQMSASKPHLLVAGAAGGRHHDAEYYRKLAEEKGVGDLVTFIPRYISDEEVGDLFKAADWITLPYRDSFTSQSGVLNVAAHYERPVLVSSSPVLRETVQICDIGVVSAGDMPKDLAKSIDEMSDRVERKHEHNFEEYRDRFSWQQNARQTLEVYQSLTGSARQVSTPSLAPTPSSLS